MPKAAAEKTITIARPSFETLGFDVVGTAPLVQLRFSQKSLNTMIETQKAGEVAKTKKKREAKNFEQLYLDAIYFSTEGWAGIPAHSFRNAMINAARVAGIQMTKAKMLVFVEADGKDRDDGTPLVRVFGDHEMRVDNVRNATGVADVRPRAMWRDWGCELRVRYDKSFIDADSVTNLLMRAGAQVGVGEGRPFSKNSAGLGWGTFELGGGE